MERNTTPPAQIIREHPLFQKLFQLELPMKSSAIFAGAAMIPHGLGKKVFNDIDMVAVDDAWEVASSIVTPKKAALGGYKVVVDVHDTLGDKIGEIEIFDSWGPGEWDIRNLIKKAHLFEGLRFVQLHEVLRWKRLTTRDKDLPDIEAIEDYLRIKK